MWNEQQDDRVNGITSQNCNLYRYVCPTVPMGDLCSKG